MTQGQEAQDTVQIIMPLALKVNTRLIRVDPQNETGKPTILKYPEDSEQTPGTNDKQVRTLPLKTEFNSVL